MTHSREIPPPDGLSSTARRMEAARRVSSGAVPEAQIGANPVPEIGRSIPRMAGGPDFIVDADGNWVTTAQNGPGPALTMDAVLAARRRMLNQINGLPTPPGAPRPRRNWTLEQMAQYLAEHGIQLPDDPEQPPVIEPPAQPPPPAKRDAGRGFDL
jgi:hypothetical protein